MGVAKDENNSRDLVQIITPPVWPPVPSSQARTLVNTLPMMC